MLSEDEIRRRIAELEEPTTTNLNRLMHLACARFGRVILEENWTDAERTEIFALIAELLEEGVKFYD